MSRSVHSDSDDDEYDKPVEFSSIGSINSLTEYEPDEEDRAAMAARQPIGFLHSYFAK